MAKSLRTDTLIKVLPGERFTPYSLAEKLKAQVILESSSFKKGRQRYSLLMVKEAFRVYQREGRVFLKKGGKSYEIKSKARDILDVLMYFAGQHNPLKQDFPFPAGGMGYLSFEFSQYCDTIPFRSKADPLGLPEALFLFGHIFIVFDHYTDVLYLIGLNYKESEIDLEGAMGETIDRINDLDFNYLASKEETMQAEVIPDPQGEADFKEGVRTIKDEIVKGNLLQAVLSRRVEVKTDLSALGAYRKLRSSNPSPYLFYLDFEDYQLFGSSPEVHVKVHNGTATIRPIAGTRKRGADEGEDRALEQNLLDDPKERAEHLMLVDLARNDLGRFCEPGSVEMVDFMTIERYSHVMHIVSTVEGQLKEGKTGLDAIRATFPAGTVSGAPKIQAIKTVDSLEKNKRGFYAGLVGYLEPDGNLDTCITIRAGLKKGDTMILQAGAGIVHDSTPERELEETKEKLGALAASLGLEV